jgi:membrane protein YdbS with pleckstrin-like domain
MAHLPTKKEIRLLGAFNILPDIKFYSQLADEQVVLVLRAHPITQVTWVLNAIFVAGIIGSLPYLLSFVTQYTMPIFVQLFLYILVLFYSYLNLLNWIFNIGIVTTKRIIDIDIQGFINKHITTATLTDVQETNVRSGGFLASYFNFGNVHILTSSFEKNIEFLRVPYPDRVLELIDECKKHAMGK